MKATLTDLHRRTKDVMRPVLAGQGKVTITEFGEDKATISPVVESETISAEDFRRLPFRDEDIVAAIKDFRG